MFFYFSPQPYNKTLKTNIISPLLKQTLHDDHREAPPRPLCRLERSRFILFLLLPLFLISTFADAIHLRKEHHILGNLVGALPEHPRQHHENGLPLMLMPEEVRLLQCQGLATIVDHKSSREPDHLEQLFTSDHLQTFYRQLQTTEYEQMNREAKTARKAEIDAQFERIAAGKAKKLGLQNLTGEERAEFEAALRAELYAGIDDLPRGDQPSLLPARFHLESPYQLPETLSPPPLFELPPLAPRSLPALKFAVFEHFRNRGYYLSDGLKFGAHFLAYDHSPMIFHAKFIIICIAGGADEVTRFEETLLQAYGRLGKNVRKNVVIAHWKNEEDVVVYKHVQWNALPGFS